MSSEHHSTEAPKHLSTLSGDTWLLLSTRFIRLFAYGALSVVLVFYLVEAGLTEAQTGLLLTLTLLGDTIVSLVITTRADRFGRRRMLIGGAVLMTLAGLLFAATTNFWLLLLAATVGVVSPSGQEVGPFQPIEQAALTRMVSGQARTNIFGWYSLIGAVATALGALAAGIITAALRQGETMAITSYRGVVVLYAALGVVLALVFSQLSPDAEAAPADRAAGTILENLTGLPRSRRIVTKLAALFALDAFGGGFVSQSIAAYWFHLRFGADPVVLGPIFFGANILAGLSALVASRMAARFGLVETMVWTHLPSNVLLILLPLMPTLPLAVAVLLVRFSISQMDVPTRQSYVMAIVPPEERSAAGGITGVARTLGAAVSPLFVGFMFARASLLGFPFFIAGTLKICYDLLLYKQFVRVQPLEEIRR
jgi:MFS family permease